MIHFVRQLQAYYQLEVIECSWQAFEETIAKNDDGLDGLISAHKAYLGRLVTRILFQVPGSRDKVVSTFFGRKTKTQLQPG